jgi:hypothetical protein
MGSCSTAAWAYAGIAVGLTLIFTTAGCGPQASSGASPSQEPLGELTRESPCPSPVPKEGRLPAIEPRACLLPGRRLSVTLVGSGSCVPRPVEMSVESRRVLRLVVRPDVGSDGAWPGVPSACTDDLTPAHTTLELARELDLHAGLRIHVFQGAEERSQFWLTTRPRATS